LEFSIRPHSSAHSGDSSTQCPTLLSWPSIRSFTWQGLETSSWSSSRVLDRPTPQRHCMFLSCQPLETGHLTGHGGATRQPELATRWRRRRYLWNLIMLTESDSAWSQLRSSTSRSALI